MVAARSCPPATSARPCGACTAARRGPSRCWSWSLTAGKSRLGKDKGVPPGRPLGGESPPVTQRAPLRPGPLSLPPAGGSRVERQHRAALGGGGVPGLPTGSAPLSAGCCGVGGGGGESCPGAGGADGTRVGNRSGLNVV